MNITLVSGVASKLPQPSINGSVFSINATDVSLARKTANYSINVTYSIDGG